MDADHLIAHRGWQSRYPENTLPAIEGAIDAGARFIEIDVQLSADQVPYLFHDATLQRISRQPGRLHDYHSGELAAFSAGEPGRFGDRFADTPLATLAAAVALIERHPAVHLFTEIKAEATGSFGQDTVHDAVAPLLEPILDRCTLISFDFSYLRHARERGWARVGPVLGAWEDMRPDSFAALEPVVVFVDRHLLPRGEDVSALPWPLAVYEIDDPAEARELLDRGVRWIETFAVGEMIGTAG